MQKRPSIHEIDKKIRGGKESVNQGNILLINHAAIVADASDLEYQISNLQNILFTLLNEVQTSDYVGGYPPHKSYEPQIKDSELFAFKWKSTRLGCNIYLKFCLKNGVFYLVSLHEDKQKN